jgi:hypothetical protein
MRPSLPELLRRFADSLLDEAGSDAGIGVYRNTVFGNYRNALAATYPVVRELTGAPLFGTAVDAFVRAHPSTGGDLNVYGGTFPDFLASYPHAAALAYLHDVARLEWALDEASRAFDASGTPEATITALAALPGDEVPRQRFVLDPSCRLMHSPHPVFRIWQLHQTNRADGEIDWNAGGEDLLVRREGATPTIERLSAAEHAWLSALAAGADLASALDAALAADETFDLGTTLRERIADGTLMAVASSA